MNLHVVILAAGQGQRMQSKLPKVLHPFAGTPILERIIQTVQKLNPEAIHIIYGNGGDFVPRSLSQYPVQWYKQDQQMGTAHALAQALPDIPEAAKVLVLVGDIPLISEKTLKLLVDNSQSTLGLVTAHFENPTGLGRILRDEQDNLIGIVEEKDATKEQKSIREINTGIMLSSAQSFKALIPQLNNHNAQNEYYLTDIINLLAKDRQPMHTISTDEPEEVMGINDRIQLEQLERFYHKKVAKALMLKGVAIADINRFDARGRHLEIGQDSKVDINVIFEGDVIIGSGCEIGPGVLLKDVTLGNHVEINAHSVIEGALIADHCVVGPFARIRPGTSLAEESRVGNFVEIKKSEIGKDTKINHLSYIGDTTVGSQVNIGAGTITCNYDGANKNRTVIEDNVFVGSNSQLVAPLTIAKGSTIGAGSTITRNTPENTLTLSRAKQVSIPGWTRGKKKKK